MHKTPKDLQKTLSSSKAIMAAWENITPLARNEWICWIESAKKEETRNSRIKRVGEDLMKGKRRPCCWAGCPHR
jgi:uncharacterized protein YdeI (YjbR/CyaY-like superfamily)